MLNELGNNEGSKSAIIAKANTGIERAVLTQKRRLISMSSSFFSLTAFTTIGSSAIPHLGQVPAWS